MCTLVVVETVITSAKTAGWYERRYCFMILKKVSVYLCVLFKVRKKIIRLDGIIISS